MQHKTGSKPVFSGQREGDGGVPVTRRRVAGKLRGELQQPDHQVPHDDQVRGAVQCQCSLYF